MVVHLPPLKSMATLFGLIAWFIGWLPGLVWLVNACLGGRVSWLLIESMFLLVYSIYATVEIVQVLARRGETVVTREVKKEPTLVIEGAPGTVKEAFNAARAAGAIREVL